MNRTQWQRRGQHKLPAELNAEKAELSLVFLPVAGLEWHGPHLTIGTDGLNAEYTALAVAEQVGGVVMPALYMSTERERPPEMLESLGFDREDHVIGMDFPTLREPYPSQYFPEEVFAMTLAAHIRMYIEHGYRQVFLVNGHGATNHNEVITRLCRQYSAEYPDATVTHAMAFPAERAQVGGIAHAGKVETSLMMHLDPELVDLSRLPPKPAPLRYRDYGIVDEGGFTGDPGPDYTVPPDNDPRDATAEFGKQIFNQTVNEIVGRVRQILEGSGR